MRALLFSLTILSLEVFGHSLLCADEISDTASEIRKSYQPYLQVKATWRVGQQHRSTFVRDNNRGKYEDHLIIDATKSKSDPKLQGMHAEIIAGEGTQYQRAGHRADDKFFVSSRMKTNKTQFLSDFGSLSPSPSFGVLFGEWIPDVLTRLENASLSDVVFQGRSVRLVEGKTTHGATLSIWFDTADRIVRKIHYVTEYPLRADLSWEGVSEIARESIPKQVLQSTYTMEDFAHRESAFVPQKVIEETTYPDYPNTLPKLDKRGNAILDIGGDGKVRLVAGGHQKVVSVLEEIRFGKPTSDDLALTIEIPNGTRVVMEDAKHLDFRWHDGKILAVSDEAAKALAEHRFLGGPGSPRFWSFLSCAVLFCVLLYVKIRRGALRRARVA